MSNLPDKTHAGQQGQVHLRGGGTDHDGQLPLAPKGAQAPTRTLVQGRRRSINGATKLPLFHFFFAVKTFVGRLGL